jgi:hypothetical protein
VKVFVGVFVIVGVKVRVGVFVAVGVSVAVGVRVGVSVLVGVGVMVGVAESLGVKVAFGVLVFGGVPNTSNSDRTERLFVEVRAIFGIFNNGTINSKVLLTVMVALSPSSRLSAKE